MAPSQINDKKVQSPSEVKTSNTGHNLNNGLTFARPSMRGWWMCHVCRQTNNPATTPQRCPTFGIADIEQAFWIRDQAAMLRQMTLSSGAGVRAWV
ncbi:hypothetical protein M409DRAFT_26689 [Zasmidium cellare ATCC 36951]|uniref:Uncharacterized protein n=1 Tax=Zasmidium cellare ATCC 36951 TaxID=1080233 RepID=A0A6A6C7K6_ZASCE|nr:uncharacterized protein M409DRAFT_26689 [Zasmidium cellare ATCC 36951]KAF2162833.1 hypothetical protein M409DRAFT_26689 [Zasmidium cellare ATCC 36951]